MSGYKVDRENNWSLIGKRDPSLPQMFYPVSDKSITLSKGDVVAARFGMI